MNFNRSHQLAIDNQSEPDNESHTTNGEVVDAIYAAGLEPEVVWAAVEAVRLGQVTDLYLRSLVERHLAKLEEAA